MRRWIVPLAALWAAASPAQKPSTDAEDRALEEAFDPPGAREAPPPPPGKLDADVPPPRIAEQAAETEEERAEREFAARLDAASTEPELAVLARQAAALGPLVSLQVAEQWAINAASTQSPSRPARARAWLLACGPGPNKEVARCRSRALEAMRECGGALKAEVAKLEEADRCVASATPGPEDRACLAKASAVYRRNRDRLMLARAALAGLEPEDVTRRRAALKLCPEPRCASLRAAVLEQLASEELEKGAADQAVRDALDAVRLRQSALPASQRLYARTEILDRTCAALEQKAPRGKCRAMEQQVLGGYVFRDYSRTNASAREGLAPAEARVATDHYSVLLTPCLQEYGEKSGSGRYKISWTILNDGHVTNVEAVNVDPRGRLMGCLKSQFTRWRYPRYKGEYQHVEQEFRVSGTNR